MKPEILPMMHGPDYVSIKHRCFHHFDQLFIFIRTCNLLVEFFEYFLAILNELLHIKSNSHSISTKASSHISSI